MNTTVPMPAWMRRSQQSWWWQVVGLPALLGFGGSLLLKGCLTGGLENIQSACLWSALDATLISFLTVLISGHSPGSVNFAVDGTSIPAAIKLKELADNVIEVKARAVDPAFPNVGKTAANNAEAAADSATRAVVINNQIVKTALANEAK